MGVIYYIRCKDNDRVYIGSTTRKPNQRWLEHLHYLRKNKHHSQHLQRTYNKYGEDSLEYLIAENVDDNNLLLAREQFHIWRFDVTMNGAPVSDSIRAANEANRGRVMPREERLQRSMALKETFKDYDFSDRATEERREPLRRGWVKRKENKEADPRTDEWIRLYKSGMGLREIAATVGGCRQSIRIRLIDAGVFDRQRKYERKESTSLKISDAMNKWIDNEKHEWAKLYKEGVSIRKIEAITGRTRKMIARELKAMGIMNDSKRS